MKTRTIATLVIALACAGGQLAIVHGQAVNDVRRMFDSGQYQQVIAAAGAEADPRVTFLRAQSHQKLSQGNEARQAYTQLAARPESDAWRDVGRSALALMASDPAGAVEASNQAVAHNGALPEAYFQQGLALSARQDFAGASVAFQKASDLDPNWAYAHYYAGLAYSKVKRIDLTAQHFQTFLRLAPQAPERGEVQSILRTLNR
jgi:tetratricopeptide (TPR) repeat protein